MCFQSEHHSQNEAVSVHELGSGQIGEKRRAEAHCCTLALQEHGFLFLRALCCCSTGRAWDAAGPDNKEGPAIADDNAEACHWPAQVRSFGQQLLESVAYLHELRLIHTDLKPENILLASLEAGRPSAPADGRCLLFRHHLASCAKVCRMGPHYDG